MATEAGRTPYCHGSRGKQHFKERLNVGNGADQQNPKLQRALGDKCWGGNPPDLATRKSLMIKSFSTMVKNKLDLV